jgi:uncharacterized Zn finger protein
MQIGEFRSSKETLMGWHYGFNPYVPVAQRRAKAAREVAKRTKKGQTVSPVRIEGRAIASTFWGQAWCTNLEGYSDFENRLPRGRTYVRNGSVVDLKISKGRIKALVSGSELYEVNIEIAAHSKQMWRALKSKCAGQIGTLVELLQGKLSKAVMEMVTHRDQGLFPKPKEIEMRCSCPDYAGMCKHVAAVMYGVGNRLDTSPELLFELRAVDHLELIEQAIPAAPIRTKSTAPTIRADDLGAIFDIEIGSSEVGEGEAEISDHPVEKVSTKGRRGVGTKVVKKGAKKVGKVKKASATKKKTKTKPVPK